MIPCLEIDCARWARWIRYVGHPAGGAWIPVCDRHVTGAVVEIIWDAELAEAAPWVEGDDLTEIERYANEGR
jgi:hypothetical protein